MKTQPRKTTPTWDIFISAAEPSADLHGDHLIQYLKKHEPQLKITGICGPLMRQHDIIPFLPMEEFQVMGFTDVIYSLPRLYRHLKSVENQLMNNPPKLLLTIDYPGWHLRLIRNLRKKGYKGKIVHYVCPSVWAWGKKRIPFMERHLDHLAVIYPFEKKLFDPKKLAVSYVGNPVKDYIDSFKPNPQKLSNYLDLESEEPILAVFAGSRLSEVQRHLPMIVKTLKLFIKQHPHYRIAFSVATASFKPIITEALGGDSDLLSRTHFVPRAAGYDLMHHAKGAIAVSGTVTLELALMGTPTLVVYDLSWLNWMVAKWLIKLSLPYYSLPNLLLKKQCFCELIGHRLKPQKVLDKLEMTLENDVFREHCKQLCGELHKELSSLNSSAEICKIIKGQLASQR